MTAERRRRLAEAARAADEAARQAAAAGRRHPFRATDNTLRGGPCAHCGQGVMEGRHT